jgi:hypothetical protein
MYCSARTGHGQIPTLLFVAGYSHNWYCWGSKEAFKNLDDDAKGYIISESFANFD